MSEQDERLRVVAVARGWVRTPYHHFGRLKGVGIDCATLIAEVYTEAGLKPPIDLKEYSAQYHFHTSDPLYERTIVDNGGRLVEQPQIGDIVLYRVVRPSGRGTMQFAHGAIATAVTPNLRIIHAYAPSRCVLEGGESEFGHLIGAEKKFYSIWPGP